MSHHAVPLRILFVCPRVPVPPIKGDKLRAFHQIKELSRRHRVTLLTFLKNQEPRESIEPLARICDRLILVPQRVSDQARNVAVHLLSALPLQCAYYQSRDMRSRAVKEVSNGGYDVIHVQLARMMPYAAHLADAPIVVDFVDTLSLNMRRRLGREKIVMKPSLFYEWYKMKNYEASLDDRFDGAMVTSAVDRDALPYGEKVHVVPMGVDIEHFSYTGTSSRAPRTIIFTGNMGYFPNVDAVTYFCRQIFPRIKKHFPGVKFRIVGSSPNNVVSRLQTTDGSIEVTGRVPSIADELGRASIAVAPMLSGSGMQCKILEAMATGTPVVATRLATRAIDLREGRDIVIADEPEQFADSVVRLLKDRVLRQTVGLNGRKLVETKYGWSSIVGRIEDIYRVAIVRYGRRMSSQSRRPQS